MPDLLLDTVRRALRAPGMPPRGSRIVVGASGGIDSTALLQVLAAEFPELEYDVRACYLDHGLTPAAPRMRDAVEQHATALGIPFHATQVKVLDLRARRESLEHAARRVRYRVLAQTCWRFGHPDGRPAYLALGHHRDDQAETVLMMLLEGCSLRGLRGIPRTGLAEGNVPLFRPLLGVPRADLEAFCRDRGLATVEDPSNADTRFLRNRVRHRLLPLLREAGNARVVEHLAALAAEASGWVDLADGLIADTAERAWDDETGLARQALRGIPDPIATGVVHRVLLDRANVHPRDISRPLLGVLLDLTRDGAKGEAADLPHPADGPPLRARVREEHLVLEPATRAPVIGVERGLAIPLPGDVPATLFGHPCRIVLEQTTPTATHLADLRAHPRPLDAWLRLPADIRDLRLRPRHKGERFHPLGAPGSRELRRVMQDRGIPADWRPTWPVLADAATDAPLWLFGFDVSETARAHSGQPAWHVQVLPDAPGLPPEVGAILREPGGR